LFVTVTVDASQCVVPETFEPAVGVNVTSQTTLLSAETV
jgi:hypothetical protein